MIGGAAWKELRALIRRAEIIKQECAGFFDERFVGRSTVYKVPAIRA
jgi:hypothetical protein